MERLITKEGGEKAHQQHHNFTQQTWGRMYRISQEKIKGSKLAELQRKMEAPALVARLVEGYTDASLSQVQSQ